MRWVGDENTTPTRPRLSTLDKLLISVLGPIALMFVVISAGVLVGMFLGVSARVYMWLTTGCGG